MTATPETPAVMEERFLARLAAEGIVLPPEQAAAAAADFLLLEQHNRVIRDALTADAPFPLGFTPPGTT